MRILCLGDVVGQAGRDAVVEQLPTLRRDWKLDAVIVNGENAAGGFGLTKAICDSFIKAGADVVTGGDHIWDQKEVPQFIGNYPKLLRPYNFPPRTPGNGLISFTTASGKTVMVLHLMAQLFMKYQLDSPFFAADHALEAWRLGGNAQAIIVDFHGEATSEKMALGHYLDGRVSLVFGSHTHVPTADCQILPGGTGYMTDAGMCGDYNSVIGFEKTVPLKNFTTKMKGDRLQPENGAATLSGVYIETDDKTGLSSRIVPVRIGGRLQPSTPSFLV